MLKPLLYPISVFMLVLLSIVGSGCGPYCDGVKNEPNVRLEINMDLGIERLYAITFNKNGQEGIGEFIAISDYSHTELPIDMNSDTTTFMFEHNGAIDILQLMYTRNVQLESKACGFTLSLEDMLAGGRTTFNDVIVAKQYNEYLITIE